MAARTRPTLSFHEDEFMRCISDLNLRMSKCCASAFAGGFGVIASLNDAK
jgi:hypothetical protein